MTSLNLVTPEISVIIPVLHEGQSIGSALDQLAAVAGSVRYEVIVVDGDPQGSTVQYLPASPYIHGIVAPPGRGAQMNAGTALAQASILLFLHADVELPPQALPQIHKTMQTVGAGAFDFAIRSPRHSFRWISQWACWRSRLTRIPFGDQAIFMARDTFNKLGGYQHFPILEDVDLMRRLKRQHVPIRFLPDRVLVSPRRWEQEGILFCTLRNWILLMLHFLGVSPHHLAQWYRPLSRTAPTTDSKNLFKREKSVLHQK